MCQVWQAIAEHAQQLPRHDLTAAQRTDQVRAKQMIAFLQTHFREKLTLDQVAQAASVSRNTCLSCFRRVLGLSPMEYLTQRRLEYALHLLLTSDLPVAQVAEACGFGDASYFGKRFRKQMGLTPLSVPAPASRHPAAFPPPTETCNRRRLSCKKPPAEGSAGGFFYYSVVFRKSAPVRY